MMIFSTRLTSLKRLAMVVSVLALATACSSRNRESDLLDRLANLDKETIFEQAEALYADKDYVKARDLFGFVYDTFPNDPLGHKAALLWRAVLTRSNKPSELYCSRHLDSGLCVLNLAAAFMNWFLLP